MIFLKTNLSVDVTPPILRFRTSNRKYEHITNSPIWISWDYNEPATSNCTLKTPNNTLLVNCSEDFWKSEALADGFYFLSVSGTDDSGNTDLNHFYFLFGMYKFPSKFKIISNNLKMSYLVLLINH